MYVDFSPDRSEKPRLQKNKFSCPERATNGSSFEDIEKYFFKESRSIGMKRRAGLAPLNIIHSFRRNAREPADRITDI